MSPPTGQSFSAPGDPSAQQRLLRTLLDHLPVLVYILDSDQRIVLANRAMEEMFGAPPGGLTGLRRHEFMAPEDAAERHASDQVVLSEGQASSFLDALTPPGGPKRVFLATKAPWRDEQGRIVGIVGMSVDITGRQVAEQSLRVSEETHRLLFEKNPQPMWVYDLETLRFLAVNEAAVRAYGYTRDEFLGMTLEDIRPPEDLDRLHADLAATTEDLNFAGEWRHRTKSGALKYVEIRSYRLGWDGRDARLAIAFDVTERKNATEELDRFFTLSQDLLCIASKDGQLLRLNPQWARTFGYSVEELTGRNFAEFVHPDDSAPALGAAARMAETPELVDFVERFRCRDGSYRTLEWRSHRSGDVIYSVARDVTEKRAAEERLRDLSRAIEQSPASVVITDTQGRIKYVNPKFEQLTGYSFSEVRGRNPRILKSGTTSEQQYRELWNTILAGEMWEGEFENRRKDGSTYLERATISPVRDDAGVVRHFVAVKEDITERRALEAQLFQAQKLEAIGLLAGGVAHDFNNLLTIINGYSELLAANPALPAELRKQVRTILQAGEQAAGLTRRLLAFGRQQASAPTVVDLNRVAEELRDFYRRVLPENIELRVVTYPQPALVIADPAGLQQVVMNLVVNARDAMPAGGRLQIRIGRVALNESPGNCVVLEVTDTGKGMNEEVRARLFEPFFTTKPLGQGTGLGLATVYGIVKQAGGLIRTRSAPGEGATFSVYLPDADTAPVSETRREEAAGTASAGETVLLVEDYDDLRQFASLALKNLGYHVLEARSGEEAVELARCLRSRLDLLLTDVLLPGVSGPEVAGIIRPLHPDMGVVYMSGYVAGGIEQQALSMAGAGFLTKPFTVEALAKSVHESIHRRSSRARILVADDEASIRELLAGMLAAEGYEVETACDATDALAKLTAASFDLFITDTVIPRAEGLEGLVARREQWQRVKVIAISGAFSGDFLRAAELMGARATLLKPISKTQLLKAVREALRGGSLPAADYSA
jgi:two-component system, cell cycle sensor histidine kinase and response regulator CckA